MRSVVELFLRRPVMSVMIVAATMMMGTVSVSRLSVGLLPNIASPGITIITRWPGVAAEKIEEILTIPIERVVSDIPGIEKIVAVSSEGESKVNLIFAHDADIKIKILEASERVQIVRDGFPREVEEPGIVRYDPTDKPVFIINFSSDTYDLKRLREIVDKRIKLRFERIEGVSEVFVGGGFEREIQVLTDPARLHALNISVQPVVQTVAANNVFIPAGTLRGPQYLQVYTDSRYNSIDQIQALDIPGSEEGVVRLDQVANVIDHWRDRDTISRTNGEDRVTIYVQKAGNANTLAITEEAEVITEGLAADFGNIEANVAYNQGKYIRRSIDRVAEACIYGAIIAVAVLYYFLRRFAVTIVIALTIPCSILATFFLMFLSDLELNVMSLSGLALGAGMLIDNSIVVSEAIEREVARIPNDPFQAVSLATSGVVAEIISSTLTTIVVFIPLIFSNPETRLLYQSLSLTVIYSLLASLFFSLTILPSLVLALLRFENRIKEASKNQTPGIYLSIARALDSLKDIAVLVRDRVSSAGGGFIATIARRTPDKIVRFLRRARTLTLSDVAQWYRLRSRPVFRNVVRSFGVVMILLAVTPLLFRSIKKEYTSPLDSGDIEASVDLETGTHLDRTQEIVQQIEAMVRDHPGVTEVNSKVEKWHATLNIKTDSDYRRSKDTETIIEELRQITDPVEDAFVYYNVAAESGGTRELDIEFYGNDVPELKEFCREMSGVIQNRVEGIDQVVLRFRESKQDIMLLPQRTKVALNQTTVSEVGSSVRQLITGSIITKYYDEDREVDVRFRAPDESLDTPEKVASLMVPLGGRALPLGSLATFAPGEGETRLWRKNKRKSLSITLKVTDRSLDEVAADIDRLFATIEFPDETIYTFGEEYERMNENQRQMLIAIALSIVIIYLLLGVLFESYSQPLIIMVTVPLTITGVLLFLAVTRMTLNLSVYIGLIMLGGIVVNNAILVVSTINSRLSGQRIPQRHALIRPILAAASLRIRPILMTTLTTVFGMAPLVFDYSEGSGLWRPLAITVSFGLSISLFISLVLVPFASYLYYRLYGRNLLNRQQAGQSA